MYFRATGVITTVLLLAGMVCAQGAPANGQGSAPRGAADKPAVASDNLPSKETVDAFMKQMFGFDPGVSWTIAYIKPAPAQGLTEVLMLLVTSQGPQRTTFYISQDQKYMIVGDLLPFGAKPFGPVREQLEKGVTGPAHGPADAPVTLVEFSDLQCPRCKEAQPRLEQLMQEEKNVRVVFQNFPLPSHDWSAKAAAYADCVGRTSNDAFWKFVHGTYEAQTDINAANAEEKLTGIADASGVKGSEIAACAAKPETADRVQQSLQFGTSLGVNGTPTVFINGRKFPNFAGLKYEGIKMMVEFYATQK